MTEQPKTPGPEQEHKMDDSRPADQIASAPQTGEKAPPAENPPAQEEAGEAKTEDENAPQWELDLDMYPLREKSKDPKWAVRAVWIWVAIALASLAFILTLLVLGLIYD